MQLAAGAKKPPPRGGKAAGPSPGPQADDFEAPARLRVRAPELYGRRSAPRAIADLRLRPNNYRGPNPEMGAICNTRCPLFFCVDNKFESCSGLTEVWGTAN